MPDFKLSALKTLFPDDTKVEKQEKEDKKTNYGQMFDISSDLKKKIIEYMKQMVDESKRQREKEK